MNKRTIKPIDKIIANKIREARRLQGVSQEQLATDLGITFQQVQKYERAMNRVSASRLIEIADTLKMPVIWFYDIQDNEVKKYTALIVKLDAENTKLKNKLKILASGIKE